MLPRALALRRRRLKQLLDAAVAEGPHPPRRGRATWTPMQRSLQTSFCAFDRLPEAVRHALHEAIVTFDPVPIATWWTGKGRKVAYRHHRRAAEAVRQIQDAERHELFRFAVEHLQRHGTLPPSMLAEASIQRRDTAAVPLKAPVHPALACWLPGNGSAQR